MTTTEFWLAWLFNLRFIPQALALLAILGFGGSVIAFFAINADWEPDDSRLSDFGKAMQRRRAEHLKAATKALWLFPAMFVVMAGLASIPDPGDLWKLRVGLLKLDLASPENVQKVGGHVEKVVKALECKHLQVNCPTPEKEHK